MSISTATLAVARLYLFPNYRFDPTAGGDGSDPTGGDVIEDVDIDRDRSKKSNSPRKTVKVNYKPSFALKDINASFDKGYKWIGARFNSATGSNSNGATSNNSESS